MQLQTRTSASFLKEKDEGLKVTVMNAVTVAMEALRFMKQRRVGG